MLSVAEKIKKIQSEFESLGYAPFPITYKIESLKPGVAGKAKLGIDEIVISKDYLAEHPYDVIQVTIPHEICHLYVNKYKPNAKQHHGPEFRWFMQLIGLKGDTYHQMKTPDTIKIQRKTKTRYVYKTANNEIALLTKKQHEKALRGLRFLTKKTREYLTFTEQVKTYK